MLLAASGCGGGGGGAVGVVDGGTGGGGSALSNSASLSWDQPSFNTDETPANDLAGFKVYYGTSSGNYTNTVDIGNATSVVINDLDSGTTYFFAVTAYDSAGNESTFSAEVSKTAS